jgi:transposase-like protein
VKNKRPALFRGRHFQDEIIVLCHRWYLRYSFGYRDLEEMMAEWGLSLDHSTIARWVLRYAPILSPRIRCEMRRPNRSWRMVETYMELLVLPVCVAGDEIALALHPLLRLAGHDRTE